ncbi:hypothetical protein ACOK4R_35910 (plasmid) [Pseudomonas fluorescens]|uniref:hypothetical protein n=1 Tax=Pseudomonas fluorescens TaxID=294 RepID=UPI001FD1EEFA|nr:hypothetical protein [Pseudomonas fluorescens]
MSYEGYTIAKHSSCWILHHPSPEHQPVGGKTKKECIKHLAGMLLEQEQSILAEAYQEKMRNKGEDYSYFDALDALIHEASHNSKAFIEGLRPELKKIFADSGAVSFEIEYIG